MKARIQTMSLWLTGEVESLNRYSVQIICKDVDERTMNDLYNGKASVMRLPSGKLSIIIDREDIVSINFIGEEGEL